MATSDTALSMLAESRDGERIFDDDGATITRLAEAAGVRVEYVHVDVRALTCERRVTGADGSDATTLQCPVVPKNRG